jgi:transposase
MAVLSLRGQEVVQLEKLLTAGQDARQLQRARALLWLDEGDSVEEVAGRLQVTRQTVYNWVARFAARRVLACDLRIADSPRSGRPRTAFIDPLIEQVIDTDPRDRGYQSTVWTAPLLQHYLKQAHQLAVSPKSIQRALLRLRIVWKRPRHHLALQAPHWRQAKGGSNGGSGGGRAQSSSC